MNRISELLCPTCGHELWVDKGRKQAVLLYCFVCQDSNRAELAAMARTLTEDNISWLLVQQKKPRTAWSEEALMDRLTLAQKNLSTDSRAQEFLKSRGVSEEITAEFRLGCGDYYGSSRLLLPYFDGLFSESLTQLRYRRLTQSDSKKGKWCCDRIACIEGRWLFNRSLLMNWPDTDEPLFITESELDCLMLLSHGVQAVSVDTANHILSEQDVKLLRGVENVVLAFDNDAAGVKCTDRFTALIPEAKILRGYGHKDLGDLRAAIGAEFFGERLNTYADRVMAA